jgi:5-formyltetrahydrofolate cyclo-ligase
VTDPEIDQAKQAVRDRIWTLLEREGAAPVGVHGHIPDFIGANEAAARLAELSAWQTAAVVESNPDRAQLPVRVRALNDGKLLYMAVPRLATLKPFYLLDPTALTAPAESAATSGQAKYAAPTVGLREMRPVDLIVCGSVAVSRNGARIGKGAGYSDIEVALLAEARLIGPATVIATTVHDLQVIDDEPPETMHDFRVDLIVTPSEMIVCGPPRQPAGIIHDHLSADTVRDIPILRALG